MLVNSGLHSSDPPLIFVGIGNKTQCFSDPCLPCHLTIVSVNIFCKGVRNKADFSNGRGRRRGQGRHPSGLSGSEIGMWYAAKANRKRKERDLKQVCLQFFIIELTSLQTGASQWTFVREI